MDWDPISNKPKPRSIPKKVSTLPPPAGGISMDIGYMIKPSTPGTRCSKAVNLQQLKSGTVQCPKGVQIEHHQVNLDKDVSPSASSHSSAIHYERSTPEQHVDLLPFISHCCLFPPDYEFSKKELISLWVAQDLFTASSRQVENQVFASLLSDEVVLPSRLDPSWGSCGTFLYKINPSKLKFSTEYARVFDGNIRSVPDDVKHLSIDSKSIKHVGFASLKRFQNLETLFVTPTSGFSVDQVPRDLFLRLKHLRALNFSRSLISELPSSFGNLKLLRYLDLSYTPIKRLPDDIVSLRNLQTLRLRSCFKLDDGLPTEIGKLTSLTCLEFEGIVLLDSMPHGIGKDDGCRIVELKDLVDLIGALRITAIENVSSFEEAQEVDLSRKKLLSLQLRWTTSRECDAVKEEQILQYLQPSSDLKELQILSYGGRKLPKWISDPSYAHLVDMELHNCMNCECLLPIGKLLSLRSLRIEGMDKLEKIDEHFCRDGADQQYHAFPKLEKLSIEDMPQLKEWTRVQKGDFPCLNKLEIVFCAELHSLPVLSSLDSLKHLKLSYCPNISSFDGKEFRCLKYLSIRHYLELIYCANILSFDEKIFRCLKYLSIRHCPKLTKHCKNEKGKYWREIAHVPNVFIDDEKITRTS